MTPPETEAVEEESPPAVEEPAVEEPAVEEPAVEEPAVEEPADEEPAVEEPAIQEPAAEELAVEEPAVQEPAAEELAVEEPAVKEPAAEEPAVEKPAVEEPAVEEPAVEEPPVEAGSGAAVLAEVAPALTLATRTAPDVPKDTLGAAVGDPFIPGEHVSPTLEGCRADPSAYIRVVTGPVVTYICPDAEYTSGNLGKGWNELDLVPHRLTTVLGSQDTATTTYDLILAADNSLGTYEGYDIVTVPVVNDRLSHSSCTITASGQAQKEDVTGGVDDAVYRYVTISQDKGTTCVFDYDLRLSNSAALYSGSSLQAYMFEAADFQTGKRTVPIPVGEVLPQEISKDATATQGMTYEWTIDKTVTKSLDFGDTCLVDLASQDVSVLVEWTRVGPIEQGAISYEATIYATNPSLRAIQITITDQIYGVLGGDKTLEETVTLPPVLVPAGATDRVVGEISATIEGTYDAVYDKATAEYFDPDLGVPIDPDKTAEHTADIESGTANSTVTIKDVEEISAGFSFEVTAASDLSGFPGGVLPGAAGPGDAVTWSKSVSDSGSVTFTKAVTPDVGYSGLGTLKDVATVSAGQKVLDRVERTTDLSADKLVDLTVVKNTPDVFTGPQSASFTFQVLRGDVVVRSQSMVVDESTPLVNGVRVASVTFTGLEPAEYTVRELPAVGWQPAADQIVDLASSDVVCDATVTFTNATLPGDIEVTKVDDTTGATLAGATFQLWADAGTIGELGTGDVKVDATKTTGTDGKAGWTDLAWGTYLIQEVTPPVGYALSVPPIQAAVINATLNGGTISLTFKNFKLGTKSGYKWNDVTPNGVWDTGEPGINGVTIQLWADLDGSGTVTTGDTVAATAVTAKGGPRATDGYYAFTGLKAGKYVVAEVCQTGWVQSTPTPVGGVCGTGVHPITVVSGFTDVENNFGNYKPGVPTLDKASVPGDGLVLVTDVITFSVTVGNIGGAVISGPVVDTLPPGLKALAGTATGGGVISTDGRSVTWQVTLAPAASLTFFYQAEVVDAEVVDGQTLVNVATFLGTQGLDDAHGGHPRRDRGGGGRGGGRGGRGDRGDWC